MSKVSEPKTLLALENPIFTRNTKAIVTGGHLVVGAGECICLLGPNGSGKTTIAECLAGSAACTSASGSLFFDGADIALLTSDERARRGLYVAFQHVPEFEGVAAELFLYEAYAARHGGRPERATFFSRVQEICQFVGLDKTFLSRPLFNQFSGGERKRFQLLEILLLQPRLVVLDELDAGLDAAGMELFFATIARLRNENPSCAFLVVSHSPIVVERLYPDRIYEIKGQRINECAL